VRSLPFFVDMLGRWRLWRFSRRNILEGWPERISGPLTISSPGGGNRLVFEEGVELRGAIAFTGSGGTVAFRKGANVRGQFKAFVGGSIEIGERTRFNKPCRIRAHSGRTVRIGRDCLFANVSIRTSDIHKIIDDRTHKRLNLPADVVVSDRVWIAEEAAVYKGVTIGADAVVGAHSVVTRDVPAGSVVAGIPARVIRTGITWKP